MTTGSTDYSDFTVIQDDVIRAWNTSDVPDWAVIDFLGGVDDADSAPIVTKYDIPDWARSEFLREGATKTKISGAIAIDEKRNAS